METQRRRSIMPFPVGRNDTKHRVTETQSFVFLSTAHRVYGPFVCGEAADSVVPLVIFLQTVTGLCVSVFDINYTLHGLKLSISTLPALHVLTFRTSGSFQLRTSGSFQLRTSGSFQLRTSDSYWLRMSDSFLLRTPNSFQLRTSGSFQPRTSDSFLLRTFASFQPRTLGNLEEVELWVTAGGSPKGNTCGLSHPLFLTSTSKGSNHAYSAKKNRSSLRTSLSNSSRKSHRLCHSLWFMMYCVTTSFPDIEAVAVHERRQRKRSRQLHQHTHVVLCGSTPFEVDVRERG